MVVSSFEWNSRNTRAVFVSAVLIIQTDLSSYIHSVALLETIILIAMLTWQQLYIIMTWHSRNKADKTV